MVSNKIHVKYKDINPDYSHEISYYLDLGKKSYENFLVYNSECDLDVAISSYQRVLEYESNNPEALFRVASLLWEKGQIDINSAIINCRKATELAPTNTDAKLYLGYFFKADGRLEDAINEFNKAIRINFFTSAKSRIALGVSLIQKAKKSSYKIKETFVGLIHFFIGVFLLLCDSKTLKLLLRTINEESKILNYRLKGKLFELLCLKNKALAVYSIASYTTSSKEMFYEIIGDFYKKNHNNLLAAENYRKSITLNQTRSVIYHKLNNVLDVEIDTKEIIENYRHLCKLEPNNYELMYNLGHIYLEDKNYFGAINCFREVLKEEPENPYYHNSMAYALVQVDDFDGAINEYHEAINLSKDNTWAAIVCQALATIYSQAKQNIEATIMTHQMALKFDPDSFDSMIALAEIYYDKGNLDSAISYYTKSLSFDKNNPQAYCNLGFVYWEKNDIDNAIVNYQYAISLYPNYDIAYNNLGVAYLDGKNKPELALEMFDISLKINPNYALSYYNKARSLELLNKKTDAAYYYQIALDINTYTNEIDPEEITKKISQIFRTT